MNENCPTVAEQVAEWPVELQQAFELAKEEIAVSHGLEPGFALDNLAAVEIAARMVETLGAMR